MFGLRRRMLERKETIMPDNLTCVARPTRPASTSTRTTRSPTGAARSAARRRGSSRPWTRWARPSHACASTSAS